jgi:hypothetical protein
LAAAPRRPSHESVAKQRRDSFVSADGSGKLQTREKTFYSLQAEMKLNLVLFARLAVYDVPVALRINNFFPVGVVLCNAYASGGLKEFVSKVNK